MEDCCGQFCGENYEKNAQNILGYNPDTIWILPDMPDIKLVLHSQVFTSVYLG